VLKLVSSGKTVRHRRDLPGLPPAYAEDFCGTKTLRDASREQVEAAQPSQYFTAGGV
jgi:hypothetical protein